jgi:chromosome segregation ATPase
MPVPQSLNEVIDDLVASKTLSLDALEGLTKIRDNARALEAKVGSLTEAVASRDASFKTQSADLNAVSSRLSEAKQREADIAAREKTHAKLELDKAVADAKAATWSECFHTIFKNVTVRDSVCGNIPVPGAGGQYPVNMPTSNTTIREVE